MKKNLSLGSLVITLCMSSHLLADNLKIGYVNFEQAFQQEHEAQKYIAELKSEDEKIAQAEQKARTEIEAEMTKFQETMGKLDEKTKQAKQMALGNKINGLQQQFMQERASLEQKRKEKEADVLKKNQLLLNSIAREENYYLVIHEGSAGYLSEEILKNNLTPKLVLRHNMAYPVKPDAKKPLPIKKASPVKAK